MRNIEARGEPVEVLLLKDSPGDVRLTRGTFASTNSSAHLNVASDGVEATWRSTMLSGSR